MLFSDSIGDVILGNNRNNNILFLEWLGLLDNAPYNMLWLVRSDYTNREFLMFDNNLKEHSFIMCGDSDKNKKLIIKNMGKILYGTRNN